MSIKGGSGRGGSNVVPLVDRPLSYPRAMARCKTLWKDGKFTWVPHADERLLELGWDIADMENMIRFGRVVEHSKPGNLWRYTLEGPTAEQHTGRVVYELAGELLIFVSVIRKGKWRT